MAPPPFESTRAYCYRFARYTVLEEIQEMPEVKGGADFRITDLTQGIINRYITPEQQQIRVKKKESERTEPIHSIIKFFASFIAKQNEIFIRISPGVYRAQQAEDISDAEIEDAALQDEVDDAEGLEGWIYAFTFKVLMHPTLSYPIKIGKTITDVDGRIAQQCKGSATFDNPESVGRWKVKRVNPAEFAIHYALKARGKWRENVPGTEWFNTTPAEIESIIKFLDIQ